MNRTLRLRNALWIAPVLLAILIRLVVIFYYGPYVSIHSDDAGYLRSAEWLLQSHIYAYYTPDAPTVHMLPGMTFILAGVLAVFGQGALGLYAGKIVFTLIGAFGIVGAYQSVAYVWNRYVALAVALFLAVYVPGIETDTLFLTETPFMAAFAWTVFWLLKVADTHKLRHVVFATLWFMVAMYFRPNLLLWAVVALAYLLMKRYPWRKLVGQGVIAAAVVIACILPWWIRNFLVFHQFIALTDDAANPLLLGTFQGIHFPAPNNPTAVEHHILDVHPNLRPQSMHEIPWFKAQEHAAMYRIREWHRSFPQDFWRSYLWIKPGILWTRAYFPIRMLGILPSTMKAVQPVLLWASLIGHGIALLFARGKRKEVLLVLLTLLYFTVLFAVFFAYERYNVPLMWLMFSGVPSGVYGLIEATKWLAGGRRRAGARS
ncbi:ArnT family glycosyltransferase [Alicyclobacillus fastidiosus]|uniref:Glycosyltransferase family 39 protein n=1 Tax=Alicyclobacillus fastidiosus TaxID=392011 RepID=A0ABV5AEY5_9BACL|nr:glycosyltransferase family 39 protein [Alicyclobacillus fastidiosus]WEH09460.1 glycosyltransferase family 39 protein [Alicyclobacillus fastidiosus]